MLNAAGDRIGWKKGVSEEKMIPLSDVLEVRAATEIDPTTLGDPKRPKGMAGTPVLRRSADGPATCETRRQTTIRRTTYGTSRSLTGKKAFSLILEDRTLDIECANQIQAKKIHAALKVLVDRAKAEL